MRCGTTDILWQLSYQLGVKNVETSRIAIFINNFDAINQTFKPKGDSVET